MARFRPLCTAWIAVGLVSLSAFLVLVVSMPAAAADTVAPTTEAITVVTEKVKGTAGIDDPAVRPLVFVMFGLAALVLVVTVVYWWLTRPLPDALDRLKRFRGTVRTDRST